MSMPQTQNIQCKSTSATHMKILVCHISKYPKLKITKANIIQTCLCSLSIPTINDTALFFKQDYYDCRYYLEKDRNHLLILNLLYCCRSDSCYRSDLKTCL